MSKYHDGEKQVQELAGVREDAERLSGSVRKSMPGVAQAFLKEQGFAAITWRDDHGRLWITPITGPPGILTAADEQTVVCDLNTAIAPLLNKQAFENSPVALVVMEFEKRRRMRINGVATGSHDGSKVDHNSVHQNQLYIKTAEVYANCPKYIQQREPITEPAPSNNSLDIESISAGLDFPPHLSLAQQHIINSADTFFIGTFAAGNADASHRGGNPGFVQTDGERIFWLDFPGNNMFNTLGNVHSNNEAALLFADFATGDCLLLSGKIENFDPSRKGRIANSETTFQIISALFLPNAMAFKWKLIELSSFNPGVE